MKFNHPRVRATRDDRRGEGYIVTLPDGSREWHRLQWQANARAHGWLPPTPIAPEPEPPEAP
jgi:hypothetical protein